MKDLLKDLTIVVPVRVDCEERKENLQMLLRQVSHWGCVVIVLEAAEHPMLADLVEAFAPNVRYIYVEDKKDPFHRTHYINALLQQTSTTLVGVWDSDVIVLKEDVLRACSKVTSVPNTLAYPYDGRFIMHSKMVSQRFRQTAEMTILESETQSCLGRPSCGGAFVVNRECYWEAGAENERFVGWGPEDAERLHRCQILGWNAQWVGIDGLHHLYHPQQRGTRDGQEKRLCDMRQELLRECGMSPSELRAYIEETYTWV